MGENRYDCRAAGGGCATACAPDGRRKAPRLVLAGAGGSSAAIAAHFRRLGWEVIPADTVADVRRLAVRKRAAAVVLPADAGGESGWLACAKLVRSAPKLKVVLVGGERTADAERLAAFAGAAGFVSEADGPDAIARAVGVE